MIISEKQLLVIFETARACIGISDAIGIFPYDKVTLCRIIQQIINQQSDRLIDVKGNRDEVRNDNNNDQA